MIHEFFVDNELYLNFLEITEHDLPCKNGKLDKQEFYMIVENKFRKFARKLHPDYGGTEKDFMFLLECKSKLLEDKTNEKKLNLIFDEHKYSNFDKTSLASKLGNQLFDLIVGWKDDLHIKPVFKPTSSEHEYEWIFNILGSDEKLSLNVQNLNNDLAEISHSLYQDNSLSVLVCLFVPSKKLSSTKIAYDNSVVLTFNDKILIESSNSEAISLYFSDKNNLKNDLEQIKNGSFQSKNNNELKTKKIEEVIQKDKKMIDYLQNLKLFSTNFDEKAADFLDLL